LLAESLLILFSAAAVALALACYAKVRTSLPVQLLANQKAAAGQLAEVLDRQESHSVKMVTWREDLEALLESVEGTLASVEKKRKSIAASASKLDNPNLTFDPTNLDHLRARARAMGHTDVM